MYHLAVTAVEYKTKIHAGLWTVTKFRATGTMVHQNYFKHDAQELKTLFLIITSELQRNGTAFWCKFEEKNASISLV
jgi:hypothetical protein